MHARPVDPRDQTRETHAPAYRVYFWTGSTACDEWELTGADLDEVLAWTHEHARGRTHVLYATAGSTDEGVHLVRLRGVDPSADSTAQPPWARPEHG